MGFVISHSMNADNPKRWKICPRGHEAKTRSTFCENKYKNGSCCGQELRLNEEQH